MTHDPATTVTPEMFTPERINACVDACRDIPTEALNAGIVREFVFHTLLHDSAFDVGVHSLRLFALLNHLRDAAKLAAEHGMEWESLS